MAAREPRHLVAMDGIRSSWDVASGTYASKGIMLYSRHGGGGWRSGWS